MAAFPVYSLLTLVTYLLTRTKRNYHKHRTVTLLIMGFQCLALWKMNYGKFGAVLNATFIVLNLTVENDEWHKLTRNFIVLLWSSYLLINAINIAKTLMQFQFVAKAQLKKINLQTFIEI